MRAALAGDCPGLAALAGRLPPRWAARLWPAAEVAGDARRARLVAALVEAADGLEPGALAAWADALAETVAVLGGMAAPWLDPDAPWPDPARWGLAGEALDAWALARAGRPEGEARRLALRALLGSEAVLAAWSGAADRALAALRRAAAGPTARGIAEQLDAGRAFARDLAAMGGLAARWAAPSASSPRLDLSRDIAAARAWLADRFTADAVAEVRRWGLADHPGPLRSDGFQRGIVLRALAEAGEEVGEGVRRLLAEVPDDGLRWYGPWRGIPLDGDTLGLFLQLAALVAGGPPRPEPWMRGWAAWLVASTPREGGRWGPIPTWLTRGPRGEPGGAEGWRFTRDDCNTARACCLTGLLVGPPGLVPADLVAHNVEHVLAPWSRGESGDAWYTPAFAAATFLRLARLLADRGHDRAGALGEALAARLRREQAPDGGWGSPAATALTVAALAPWGLARPAAARAARFLSDTQLPDGSWPAEPLYRMPGKRADTERWYRSRSWTTAAGLRALVAVDGLLD